MSDITPPPSDPESPPADGTPYEEICAVLGFDPATIKSVTITQTAVIAVSSKYPEPQLPIREEEASA
ncbi:hypothetical protein [Timonella senegalensis]|uniref:hypothetical protein n=1 Tax=Timonella senegalensis TaxID=1465825 RepID=UPI002FDE61AC